MPAPTSPKIYHIVHVDRLPSIIADGHLWCDAVITQSSVLGTSIGMSSIKQRRLTKTLSSHPGLCVGGCVPFYFGPRSVMLYVISKADHPELDYRDGQESIVHLEADLRATVAWAQKNKKRWAFTSSNAGSYYFDDYADLSLLDKINWSAVDARKWSGLGIDESVKEGKQAEFLMESAFPWTLVARIGVASRAMYSRVQRDIATSSHRPAVEIKPEWYY